ncbi:type VI secretion system baseplate subunit TssF [Xenorhabdus sp. PB61.4]|uniref:type VI secretion system baseplate subunit TssF n=1 Tax=Xenorhabdus sp. PB61.4 TaxID=2788940 RepID=UPI001E3FD0EF|nr:type VI secretion system baseplate subunit TssF [Xenorhabdus sp. PB61.4]MCC8367462.1 type VI secretion system baseplate subunit TssF [Xenorhabdus sp. PB61.4]
MDNFQFYYQWELDYLQQIEKLASKEKPHLAENFNGCDPDIERLNQGFSVLMARLHQKIDDAFPEITLPLLQQLKALPVKGIPATSVVQFSAMEGIKSADILRRGSEISSNTGATFVTGRECNIEPLMLVAREMSCQEETSSITLTFQYTGGDDYWPISPINLFLSPDETVADALMLALCRNLRGAILNHNGLNYSAEPFWFEPLSGISRMILPAPALTAGNWAPQMLIESLYLPHVHHFLTLSLPTVMRNRLSMIESRQFSITLKLNEALFLTEAQLADAFHLHCVPVVNLERELKITLPFTPDTARYPLPLPSEQGILRITELQLKDEPGKERGKRVQFLPISQFTHFFRGADEKTWFYALDVTRDAFERLEYALVFYDSNARLMEQPPEQEFTCRLTTFNTALPRLVAGDICLTEEDIPDGLQARNLTPASCAYPPVTDCSRYWGILSHHAANGFWLNSVSALKQLLLDYDFYADLDRNTHRDIRRMTAGIVEIQSTPGDWLIRGVPHRCVHVELILDESAYISQGELFRFSNALYQFLPFCLSEDMRIRMTIIWQSSNIRWLLSPCPLQGYRPIM